MCGIVGYYGSKDQVLDTLLSGLKRLEYRGYDSSGVAIIDENKSVYSQKQMGKIINLELALNNDKLPNFGTVGIAHTRWATHGVPSDRNAHPHHSTNGKIWLVHNGIIENYKVLKTELQNKGYTFYSETDSEIVANLVEDNYNGDLKEAVLKSLARITGAYAIVVITDQEPDRIIGAKKGSPLVLGIGKNEWILASDVSAIIARTRDVVYMEDNEIVDITNGGYTIQNFDNEDLEKTIETIEWSLEDASKEGFDFFMEKEVVEQSTNIQDSYRGRLVKEDATIRFGGLIDVMDRLQEIDKVIILGMGSAFFAASLGELFFEELAGIGAKAEMSAEFRYKNNVIDEKTWVIAVSQSGETADTIAAIEEAKRKGALVTGIVNAVGSTISRITDAGVYNHNGPEISVASTKATTSQYLILLMHAILLGRINNLSYANASELINEIAKLPEYFTEVINNRQEIKKLAQKYLESKHFCFLGRKYNFPLAREGALKLKEISYVHAESFSGGELKHGPIALIDEDFPTVALLPQDSVYDKMLSNVEEIIARKGKIIAIATKGDQEIEKIANDVFFVPKSPSEEIQAIINIIPMQLLAYYFSSLKGLDVDKPRNLAKSVTVE